MAMNGLHDKAFECGLITITPDYKVKVSNTLDKQTDEKIFDNYFFKYDGQEILLPSKFLPDPEFLKKHNEKFKG
jgi:putative restriction endonuclease